MDPRPAPYFPAVTFVALVVLLTLLGVLATAARAVEVISPASDSIALEVSKGRLVRLDRPAATVFVADPQIANIQVKSPILIYLMTLKPGQTTLFAVDSREQVLANFGITVSHNLGRLRQAIREFAPRANISVASIEGALVIDGIVETASQAEDLRRLAEKFAPEKGAVINRIQVDAPG